MKKKNRTVVVIIAVVIAVCICVLFSAAGIMSAKGYGISVGRLYMDEFGNYLIDKDDNAMIISDRSGTKDLFADCANGDKVLIIHDGVEEVYPARTGGYRMVRLSKGDSGYVPDDEVLGYMHVDNGIDHTHTFDPEPDTADPASGYCGNIQTTVYFDGGKSYTFMATNSVTITDMLINLSYDKDEVCKCIPEYTVDTEMGEGYEVNLTQGFVRYDNAQTALTREQNETLKGIILWAKKNAGAEDAYSDFSFSLTWNTYGISSYNSSTGKLVKSTDATNPDDYVTTYYLTDAQKQKIYELIEELDINSYPDEYNPHKNAVSTPYMTLILSVKTREYEKTVTVKETVLSYDANNRKGQKFLDVCKTIEDILTETQEWKSLPEYEFFYQ